jgi:nitrous oxidase accessory protein NosD
VSSQQHKKCSPVSPIVNQGLAGGLLLLLLFFSFSTSAKEWQVSPGNGTLQAAIDLAQPGDTLFLAKGTYTGSVNIHQSLTL